MRNNFLLILSLVITLALMPTYVTAQGSSSPAVGATATEPNNILIQVLDGPGEHYSQLFNTAQKLAFDCVMKSSGVDGAGIPAGWSPDPRAQCYLKVQNPSSDAYCQYFNDGWDVDSHRILITDPPKSSACEGVSSADFKFVVSQLNSELQYLSDVRNIFSLTDTWMTKLYVEKNGTLSAMGNRVKMTAPNKKSAKAEFNMLAMLDSLVSIVFAAYPEAGATAHIVWTLVDAGLHSIKETPLKQSNTLQGELSELENQTTSWYNAFEGRLAQYHLETVSYWGYLQGIGNYVEDGTLVWDEIKASGLLVQAKSDYQNNLWKPLTQAAWKLYESKSCISVATGPAGCIPCRQKGQYYKKGKSDACADGNNLDCEGGFAAVIVLKEDDKSLVSSKFFEKCHGTNCPGLLEALDLSTKKLGDIFKDNVLHLERGSRKNDSAPLPGSSCAS